MIIEGALSVKAALECKRREVIKVYIPNYKRSKDIGYIIHLCHVNDVAFESISKEIAQSMSKATTHGGIFAEVGYRQLENQINEDHNILLLEGIEDPYNLAMAIRSGLAANFKTVITNQRHYQESEAIILKASAGASERVNWVQTDDFKGLLNQVKEHGYHIVSALRSDASIAYDQYDYPTKVCLCIGGERRGLSKVVIEDSDGLIHIEYDNDVKVALSAVSATAVLAFEIQRQRKK